MPFDSKVLLRRLRARTLDIVLAFGFTALCFWVGDGPIRRKDEGFPPLPTDPQSTWDTPAWQTSAHPRGDLSHPLLWKSDDGRWTVDRACGPTHFAACLGINATDSHPVHTAVSEWCCHVMTSAQSPVFDEHVYSWELVAFYGLTSLLCLYTDGLVQVDGDRSYVAGLAIATAVASIASPVKVIVGRPRPSFYAQQLWAMRSASVAAAAHVDDAVKSFPSGHSTWALCSGAFASALLLREAAPTRRAYGLVAAFAWELIPAGVGLWTAVTRVQDYRHFPSDIIGGILIGLVAAALGSAGVSYVAHEG